MPYDVKPALTAEEWRSAYGSFRDGKRYASVDGVLHVYLRASGDNEVHHSVIGHERHALAAMALDGQPFGFTWEMVDALRKAVDALYVEATEYMTVVERWNVETPEMQLASEAADRIAALLPPREPT